MRINDLMIINKNYYTTYNNLNNLNNQLNNEQKEVLIGILLADGFLEKRKITHNTRLRIDHTYPDQEKYVYHVFEIFKSLCSNEPSVITKNLIKEQEKYIKI